MRALLICGVASALCSSMLAACSFHSSPSAVPAPRGGVDIPMVVQNGKTPSWTFFTPHTTYYDLHGIASGPDGDMWYADYTGMGLDRFSMTANNKEFGMAGGAYAMAVSGKYVVLPLVDMPEVDVFNSATQTFNVYVNQNGSYSENGGAATAKSGNVWYLTELGIEDLNPATGLSSLFNYTGGEVDNFNGGVALGSDDNIWYTENNFNDVSKIVPSTHKITNFVLSQTCDPEAITAGPGGELFATCTSEDDVVALTTAGVQTYYPTGLSNIYQPQAITEGSDGNIWFVPSAFSPTVIAQLNVSNGVVTTFSAPNNNKYYAADDIASGPDGNLWMTSQGSGGGPDGEVIVYIFNPISVAPKSDTLGAVGQTVTLTVTENGVTSWTASTNKSSVATVAPVNGQPDEFLVTATGAGKATISVSDAKKNSFNVPITVI